MTIPTCAVTGGIPGDGGSCGDCDPCIMGEPIVPEAVKRLIAEKSSVVLRNGELEDENARLREAIDRVMVCGNHIATYRSDRWPDYQLDGLTREQQCDHALRRLGATKDYDMWCCWSGMMQVRDELATDAQ